MSHHLIVYIVYKYNNTLKDKIKAYFQQKIDILYFTNYKTREDLIAGLFIILDDQYNVGDIVEIDGFRGTVSSVGLKSTKVRNYLGDVRVYANRNIGDITRVL